MANLTTRVPTYISRNSVGTYVFQVRIPTSIYKHHGSVKPLIRCSLRTKDYREAIHRSMPLWLMFDEAIRGYSSRSKFNQALNQLKAYAEGQSGKPITLSLIANDLGQECGEKANPTVEHLVVEFIQHKVDMGVRAASLKWYSQKCQQFSAIMTVLNNGASPCLSMLDTRLIRTYSKIMHRYPKHALIRHKTRDMTEKERVDLVLGNDRQKLASMGYEPLGFKTVGHNFTGVRELLRYAERQQYSVARDLGEIIPTPRKTRGEKPQVKFDLDDLKAVFYSKEYTTGTFQSASDYFIPLLAVHSGMTQAECCQLWVSDIRRENGIWYIDINDQGEKLLKTELGRPRQVPIHDRIIQLGFMDYVKDCQKQKQQRLFPNEIRDANDKYPGYSKRFNRWRKQLGITVDSNGGRKNFHSFRHLVSDWLIGNQCHPGVAADIIGHEGKERMETRRTYSDGAWLKEKNEWVQRLDYGIDWDQVKKWSEVKENISAVKVSGSVSPARIL